jgi:hypothetical protein
VTCTCACSFNPLNLHSEIPTHSSKPERTLLRVHLCNHASCMPCLAGFLIHNHHHQRIIACSCSSFPSGSQASTALLSASTSWTLTAAGECLPYRYPGFSFTTSAYYCVHAPMPYHSSGATADLPHPNPNSYQLQIQYPRSPRHPCCSGHP